MAALCMLGMFTACSSDDPTPITPPEPEPTPTPVVPGEDLDTKEYPSDAFEVTIGDEAMPGKIAKFVPKDDGTAELTLEGAPVSLDALMGDASKADEETVTIPTPGVIPGSPSVTLSLTLEGEGADCTFSGSHETEYCTFGYNGSVTTDKLSLNITELKLKNTSFAGTYDLVPYQKRNALFETFDAYPVMSSLRFLWKSTQYLYVWDENYGTNGIEEWTNSMLTQSIGKNKETNVSEILFNFKSIILSESGDFTLVLNSDDADEVKMQYVVRDENTIILYVDPQTIITQLIPGSENIRPDMLTIMQPALTAILPLCQDGIPLTYGPALIWDGEMEGYWPNNQFVFTPSTDPNHVSFYLDTTTLMPILDELAATLSNDAVLDKIDEAIKSIPAIENTTLSYTTKWSLKSLPGVIDKTTQVEIGLNFIKK